MLPHLKESQSLKIELEIPEKMEYPLRKVVANLRETNNNPDLTHEEVLLILCKQYIVQEYGKYLME